MKLWFKRAMPFSANEEGTFPSLNELQDRFAEALRGGDETALAALDALASKDGGAAFAKRFSVYRNNVYYSLSRALTDAYPVVNRLVGEAFFFAMARAYLDSGSFPTYAPLHDFGSSFPEFIEKFPPVKGLPWLGDVARVELAWLNSYHSADAPGNIVLDTDLLLGDDKERIAGMVLLLHPSLQSLALCWPAVEIWQAHQVPNTEKRLAKMRIAEKENIALAVRGKQEVVRLASLPMYAGEMLERLLGGKRLLDAARGLNEEAVRLVLETLVSMGAVLGLEAV